MLSRISKTTFTRPRQTPVRNYHKHYIHHYRLKGECRDFSRYVTSGINSWIFNPALLENHFQTLSNLINASEKHRQSYYLLKNIDELSDITDIKKQCEQDSVIINKELLEFIDDYKWYRYSNKRVYKKFDKFVLENKKKSYSSRRRFARK